MDGKLMTLKHLRSAAQESASLTAQVAQAAADDIALLTASDVGAVPVSRKVNGKELSADISLSAADVGAATMTQVNTAIMEAITGAMEAEY